MTTDEKTDEKTVKVTEAERMLNLGKKIPLKKLGDVTVRELTLEQIVVCASDLTVLITSVDFSDASPAVLLKKVLPVSHADFRTSLQRFMAV